MIAAPAEPESGLLVPTAEFALFVGGAILTLLVIAFVTVLVVSIVREERAAKAASTSDDSSPGAKR